MRSVTLINGVRVPGMSFGCWRLGPGAETVDAVAAAIGAGYRSFDTAYSYGNDFYVARGIKKTGLPREELFITNKAWNTFRGKDRVMDCCKKSLRLMKLDYFDLYLVHWPAPTTQPDWTDINLSTWEGMEQLYKDGLIRAAGVSNFEVHHLQALFDGGISLRPMVNQIEFHPGRYAKELLQYCRDHAMAVEGWSPLGSGEVLKNALIMELAVKYKRSASQICLGWAVSKGVIPVPRTKNADRMAENLDAAALLLDAEDIERIDALEGIGWSGFDADHNQPEA